MMRPIKKVFFLPKTSCSLLPASISHAIVSAYIAIKAWIVLKSVCKSTTTADMATFIAELSRTIMKMVMHETKTTPHLNCGFSSIENSGEYLPIVDYSRNSGLCARRNPSDVLTKRGWAVQQRFFWLYLLRFFFSQLKSQVRPKKREYISPAFTLSEYRTKPPRVKFRELSC